MVSCQSILKLYRKVSQVIIIKAINQYYYAESADIENVNYVDTYIKAVYSIMYRKALKYIKLNTLMTVTFKLFTGILVEPGDNDRVY